MDLTPFAGTEDEEAETCDLRTNPLQEGGDDRRRPSSGPSSGQQLGQWQGRFKKAETLY